MSRAEKAKGAKLSAPANTRAEDSATFTDDRISCYPPEVNRATADGEAERDIDGTDEFMLGIYSGNLKNEKIVWDFEDPDGAGQIDTAIYNFSKGEDLFKFDVRQDLRKHGRGGLVEEIKDLRAERKELLDEIAEIGKQPVASDGGKWSGVFADICGVWDKKRNALRACVRVEANRDDIKHTFKHSPDAPSEAALATTANLIHARIDQYNALIDDEAKFVDTAAANLRGWKSATGDDVREVREDVQGTRDEVQGLKPEVEAAKTAAEGAKESAEGAKTAIKNQRDRFNEVVKDIKQKSKNADAEIKHAVESAVCGIEKKTQSMLNAHERKIGAFATDGSRKPTSTERLKIVELRKDYKRRTGSSSLSGFYENCGNDPVMENLITGECRTLRDICPTFKHFSNLMHSAQEAKSKKKREAAAEKPRKKVSKRQKRG